MTNPTCRRAVAVLVCLSGLAATTFQTAAHVVDDQAQSGAAPAPSDPPTAPDEASRLLEEGRGLRTKGKYDEALALAERALAVREQALAADDTAIADALHLVALIYDDKNDYAKAEPLNLRALAIREKKLGPDHPDVALSLFNLAWLVKSRSDFAQAEAMYLRALSIQERALGPEHRDVATTLNDLAILYNQTGAHDKAIETNQRVLRIREKVQGPESSGVALALNNLARVYENKGDYPQAESTLRRSIAIYEKTSGPEHPATASPVDGLARILRLKGEYGAAEQLNQRAIAIREKALGPDHPELATALFNFAMLYRDKGDYARAEPLLLREQSITEKRLGPTHRFLSPGLNSLATIYKTQGQFDRAEALYRRAATILEEAVGPAHTDLGVTLGNLGLLYAEGGSPAQQAPAEGLLARALAILQKAAGPEHPKVAPILAGFATLAVAAGDHTRAATYYERALAIQEKTFGPQHPDVANSLERLASVSQAQGDLRRSLELRARAGEIREHHLALNLPLGSERQKLGYLRLFAQDIDRALTLQAKLPQDDPQALDLAFTTVLRRKGRALDATSDNVAALRVRALPQDQDLFARLVNARSQLAAFTLQGVERISTDAYRRQLTRLEDAVDQLETDVAARSAEYRAQSAPITIDAVRAAIPEGAALIEFAFYRPVSDATDRSASPRYVAYVLARQGAPRWIDLGDAAEIDRAAYAWRQAIGDPRRNDVRRLARVLDQKVMQPVRARLDASTHLLVSPEGTLNLIPFAALVDESDKYLVERYSLTYLTSGRDLLRLGVPRESRGNAVVVAAPAFGEPALVSRDAKRANQAGRAEVDYSQVFFGPLPGVADEVRALRGLLPQATFVVGEQATEASVRRVNGPRLLHVATHGFFLEGGDDASNSAPAVPTNAAGTRLGRWAAWADNPLVRSGLALAGANQGRSGEDDGVLTALEVAGLDLWGTKLVVLSACNTGVGEVKNGDGVYGLRRALVLAGSESQLMSLWAVSDRTTRDLMVGYYRRLARGDARGDALRRVQLQILGDGRHAHPYYWASFIQSGEWRTMDASR